MRSNFTQTGRRRRGGTSSRPDEVYDLRGLNLIAPDQVMPDNETPFTTNSRMYAPEADEASVAIRTRKGSEQLSVPVGRTANVENIASSTGDLAFTDSLWLMQPFTVTAGGALTELQLEMKRSVVGTGHVIVEIYTSNGGLPGTRIAQGSILNSLISTSYEYLSSYFIDAPTLEEDTEYVKVIKVQEGGTATYVLRQTAAAGARSSEDELVSFSTLGVSFRYKTFLSTVGEVLGFTRRYPQSTENRTYFGMGTELYEVTDSGTATSIHSGLHPSAEYLRFDHVDDNMLFVDGMSPAKWLKDDEIEEIPGVAGIPTHVWIHQNRAFFVPKDDPTRVNFSELYNFISYRPVDFFYVDRPKNSDHIAGGVVYQDNLVIFTHETKHTIYGTNLGSFTRKEAIGTKGAVSQEAITTDNNYVYFMADDKNIYRWNGAKDQLLSAKVHRELAQIQDPKKVRLHVYNNQLRVYYSRKPNTEVNCMLLLELDETTPNKYLQWFKDTGRPVAGSLEWFQDENQLIEFSSKAGWMFFGERSNSDLGKAIDFKYWTGFKIYGSGIAKDRIKKFRPIVRPTNQPYYLLVGKAVDFNPDPLPLQPWLVDSGGAKWGSFIFGDGTKFGRGSRLVDATSPMSGRGKATQFRFECSRVETPVFIYGYFALVKSGKAR